MGFFDRFRSRSTSTPSLDDFDPLHPELKNIRVGYYLDYDLKTWEVTAYNRYDYGDGYGGEEWQLQAQGDTIYLELEADDEERWTLSRKISFQTIDEDIRREIAEKEDPPERIILAGQSFFMDESGSGDMYKNGQGEKQSFIYWGYVDEGDTSFVTVEQWGETEFEAAHGFYVETYQFNNILPGVVGGV